MGEVPSGYRTELWPKLKMKLRDARKKAVKKKEKVNPFASQGLEKFALLMTELQAKKASLVDKTGNSLSAARYLSRSAQEWTANAIERQASRCREKESPRAFEVLLLKRSPSPSTSLSKKLVEIEIIDVSQSFSFPDPGDGFDSEALVVGDLRRETNSVSSSLEDSVKTDERRWASCGDRDVAVAAAAEEEVGCSGKSAADSERFIRDERLLLLERGWARSPNSAIALVAALGACVGSRVAKIGDALLKAVSISLVVRWKRGKVYAELLQSLVARHVVPHLFLRVPSRLTILPLVRRKISKEGNVNPPTSVARLEKQTKNEVECVHERNLSAALPVVSEDSSPSPPASDCPALAILHLRAATSSESNILQAESTGASNTRFPTPACSSDSGTSSLTRRLVRKLSSKLKSKISRSSPSACESDSPSSESSVTSGGSSPRKNPRFFFSRKGKEKTMSYDGTPEELFDDCSSAPMKRRSRFTKNCSFRKERTPEPTTIKLSRKSPLNRMSSSNAMDPGSSGIVITSSLHSIATSRHSQAAFDSRSKNFDIWLIMGLLVALFFLLVSRFSAIIATSLLFFVLSYVHKESSYHRIPRRDVDTNARQALETTRKLLRGPSLYSGR